MFDAELADETTTDRRARVALAAKVCARCPVFAGCETAAQTGRPSGVWAGQLHLITTTTTTKGRRMNENSLPTASHTAAPASGGRTAGRFRRPSSRTASARTGRRKPGRLGRAARGRARSGRLGAARLAGGSRRRRPGDRVQPTPDLAAHVRTTPAMLRDAVLLLRTDLSRVTRADEHQAKVEAEEVAAYQHGAVAPTRPATVGERPTPPVAPKPGSCVRVSPSAKETPANPLRTSGRPPPRRWI
ncbi:hypothetical protein GS439_11330 [Rhodococcus hoagii]|nr:hypothetical protein [Prescottella equi]